MSESPDHFSLIDEEELIWMYEDAELIVSDPDNGPRLQNTWPKALFAGFRASTGKAGNQQLSMSLKAGDYLFTQWRLQDFSNPAGGYEEFVRQIWWEQEKTEGLWILRIVREDNDIAFQGLRKKSSR